MQTISTTIALKRLCPFRSIRSNQINQFSPLALDTSASHCSPVSISKANQVTLSMPCFDSLRSLIPSTLAKSILKLIGSNSCCTLAVSCNRILDWHLYHRLRSSVGSSAQLITERSAVRVCSKACNFSFCRMKTMKDRHNDAAQVGFAITVIAYESID